MTTCPDCDRELFGDRCPCGYARAGKGAPVRTTYYQIQGGVTKEQFGLALHEAIKCCGGILQLQECQEMPRIRESGLGAAYHKRELALARELASLFDKLSQAEQAQLMQRYPKLFGGRKVAA